ncbi:MAG: TonB-dependent receptor [Parvularculaceae bacterium]
MKIDRFAPASTGDWRVILAASASAIAFAVASPALAQPVDTIPEADEAEEEGDDDTVVVTGSRIRRDEFSATGPVQIIDPRIGELQGQLDTAALIQSSSIAAGSAQITAAISSNFVTNGGAGAATISLRGLGAERTLVLLNGRRAGPAGTRGAVNAFDLNVLPQSIIGSVEILKDGASSIYGSDAVAGVVNIITKRNLDGFEFDAFYSQPISNGASGPSRAGDPRLGFPDYKGNGGEELRLSGTWGKEFARGHLLASVDYYKRQELARGDRDYLNCAPERIFDGNGARKDIVDPRTGEPRCTGFPWGHVWLYDYTYIYSPNGSNFVGPSPILAQFDYDGNLGMFIPGFPAPIPGDPFQLGTPPGFFPVGYDTVSDGVINEHHPLVDYDTVIPETTRFTFYVDGALELDDGVELYTELLINRRETYQNGSRQFWQFGWSSSSTLPGLFFGLPGSGDPFAPGWTGDVLVSPTAYTDHADNSQRVDYLRALAGIRGEFRGAGFMENWTWDIYAQQSRNRGKYRSEQIFNDSIAEFQDFRTASCVGQTTSISMQPCIDLPWFDPSFLSGDLTAAEETYLFGTEEGHTTYTQTYLEGIFTGDLFSVPAGEVKLALGGTWRRDKIDDLPGEITIAGNAWGNTGAGNTVGSSGTKELFGEIDIPLFRDSAIGKSFDINAAGRWTDVSTYGSDTTYKVAANWQITDWMRIRGTWGTSFRAPALFELFLADQTSFLSQRAVDPCINWGNNLASGAITQQLADNCFADGVPDDHNGGGVFATIVTGGGFGVLDAETSKAKTLSIILTPDTFFGLYDDRTKMSLAVDYFDIEVNGEIAQLGAFNIIFGCLTSDFYPTDPLCTLYTRGQTGAPENVNSVQDSFINVNSQKNRGIDFTWRLDHELADGWGDFSILSQFTWQLKDTIALFEGTEVSVNGEDGEPRWVGDVNMLWTRNDWTLFWGLDVVGPTSDEGDYLAANGTLCPTDTFHGTYCVDLNAEATVYHNMSLTKEFEHFTMTAGVANVFNEHPPAVSVINGAEISTIGQSVFASNYDLVGRRIFFNLKANF